MKYKGHNILVRERILVFGSPEYLAIQNEAIAQGYTQPSQTVQSLQRNLIQQLKIAGIWSQLDALWCFASDGDDAFNLMNWIDPTGAKGAISGGMTRTENKGFQGDGTTGTLNTYFRPHIVLDDLDNSCGYFLFNMDTRAVNAELGGAAGDSGAWYSQYKNTSGAIVVGHSTSNTNGVVQPDNGGVFHFAYDGVNSTIYVNGAQVDQAPLTISPQDGGFFHIGSASGSSYYSQYGYSFCWMGRALESHAATLSTLLTDYVLAVQGLVTEHSEYNEVLKSAVINTFALPTENTRNAQIDLISGLKDNGVWDNLDTIFVFANDGGEDFARFDWKTPSRIATLRNTPIFTANKGFKGEVAASRTIDTHFIPNSHHVAGDSSQFSHGIWVWTRSTQGWAYYGAQDGGDPDPEISYNVTNGTDHPTCSYKAPRRAGFTSDGGTNAVGTRMLDCNQNLGNNYDHFENGVKTNTIQNLPTQINVLCQSSMGIFASKTLAGGWNYPNNGGVSIYFAGASMRDKAKVIHDVLAYYMMLIAGTHTNIQQSLNTEISVEDETSIYTPLGTDSFRMQVTVAGTRNIRPALKIFCSSYVTGKDQKISFRASKISGTPVIYQIHTGGFTVIQHQIVSGLNIIDTEALADQDHFWFYFDGRNEFDVTISDLKLYSET